jgi:hypothetical protein
MNLMSKVLPTPHPVPLPVEGRGGKNLGCSRGWWVGVGRGAGITLLRARHPRAEKLETRLALSLVAFPFERVGVQIEILTKLPQVTF